MKRYAILIGAEKYEDFQSTPFCHRDVDAMHGVLTKQCDYAEQDVLVFKLSVADGVSPSDIVGKIDDLLEKSKEGDSILFFYAGHGEAIENASYLILPNTKSKNIETTALPLRDVTHYLSKNRRLNIRVFDTCHSGQDVRSASSGLNSDEFTRSILEEGAQGSITFASCNIHEKSYCDEDLRLGVFTHAFIKAIEETKPDQLVYPEMVKLSICDTVAKWCLDNNRVQTPTFCAYVNGNAAIAIRRKDIVQKAVNADVDESRSLEERLVGVRGVGIISPDDFPVLVKAIEDFQLEISSCATKMNFFGAELKFEKPCAIENSPSFLHKKFVISLQQEKCLHDVGTYKEEAPLQSWERILGQKPKVFTRYFVDQNLTQPMSFLSGECKTDGFIPRAGLFFYLCPLQASLAVLYGTYFDRAYYSALEDVHIPTMMRVNFSTKQIQNSAHISLAQPLLNAFSDGLKMQIEERVKYLEWEAKKLRGTD